MGKEKEYRKLVEKRKKFMEQQMNYMDGLMRRDKQPGIA